MENRCVYVPVFFFTFGSMNPQYLFASARLGFRQWHQNDVLPMAAINAHPRVMEFFPHTQTPQQTADFVQRMQKQFAEKGYGYFAVEIWETQTFIGFIGLSEQTFTADFTPCTDVGWRLAQAHWGQGYATEGAQRCLQYAFETLRLQTVNAMAPGINRASVRVMEKIGMEKVKEFKHPLLRAYPRLENCVLYQKQQPCGIF